uniref:Large ribosomal subunit protein uL16c n=1 Tax=Cyanidium caldarium TaxID=2771 RepID=RK16_CYACA|nr:ribosomal protein L16 [Cyanidium caldarium]Q9TLT9.1 RecName: Full=Large ribosomal subunit protein uL16c; AltName: Full=50S ribosomal protein L16, chloroplastic [Cyanidium caldarium]AAF12914.1 unknown [Cyanidium caldarium]WDB00305.1 ribosomal protein L16 [Cyanidium caldarium]
MLSPKKTKYRKFHRGRLKGHATKGSALAFGRYGIQALTSSWITSRQIESVRRVIVRHLKRGGKLWIRIFPDKAVTAKPLETRMGSGKGSPEHWIAVVKSGHILFEIDGVSLELAKEAVKLAIYKLPIKCKFLSNDEFAKD